MATSALPLAGAYSSRPTAACPALRAPVRRPSGL